jgi:acetyltransferase-like isoleucine patch superfamily enzyme
MTLSGVLTALASRAGLKDKNRFNHEWSAASITIALLHLAMAYARGMVRGMVFKEKHGINLIGRNVRILHAWHLRVGRGFVAEDGCEINALSRRGLTFGDRVTVGKYALIRPTSNYGGELGEGLIVGNGSNIGPYSYIGCSGFVSIGSNVMMSPRVSIYAENHNFERSDLTMKEQGVTREEVHVEDDCWIAANTVILAGVTIGQGSIIAAGSVVTKSVPPFSVVGGVPARVIRSRIAIGKNVRADDFGSESAATVKES